MLQRNLFALALAAFGLAAPAAAHADWDWRLYRPHLYPAPPHAFPYYAQYPSAYYYPPFYNARIGYAPETEVRRVRRVKRR